MLDLRARKLSHSELWPSPSHPIPRWASNLTTTTISSPPVLQPDCYTRNDYSYPARSRAAPPLPAASPCLQYLGQPSSSQRSIPETAETQCLSDQCGSHVVRRQLRPGPPRERRERRGVESHASPESAGSKQERNLESKSTTERGGYDGPKV